MDRPLHLEVAEDAGRITKSSIACLYGSIVCTVLREFSRQKYFSEEQEIQYAHAVYRFFNLFRSMVDDRGRRDLIQWNKIMQDKLEHGTHAASSLNPGPTTYCKNCSNVKKTFLCRWLCPKKMTLFGDVISAAAQNQ